jgi:hypothetical protein
MVYGAAAVLAYSLGVICFVRIMQKAGFGSLGWVALFPPAILILILVLAFREWPISKWPDIRMPE